MGPGLRGDGSPRMEGALLYAWITVQCHEMTPLVTIWTANKNFGGSALGSGLEGGRGGRVRPLNHLLVRGFHHAHVLSQVLSPTRVLGLLAKGPFPFFRFLGPSKGQVKAVLKHGSGQWARAYSCPLRLVLAMQQGVSLLTVQDSWCWLELTDRALLWAALSSAIPQSLSDHARVAESGTSSKNSF